MNIIKSLSTVITDDCLDMELLIVLKVYGSSTIRNITIHQYHIILDINYLVLFDNVLYSQILFDHDGCSWTMKVQRLFNRRDGLPMPLMFD